MSVWPDQSVPFRENRCLPSTLGTTTWIVSDKVLDHVRIELTSCRMHQYKVYVCIWALPNIFCCWLSQLVYMIWLSCFCYRGQNTPELMQLERKALLLHLFFDQFLRSHWSTTTRIHTKHWQSIPVWPVLTKKIQYTRQGSNLDYNCQRVMC